MRANPLRIFTGISLIVNVSAAARPQYIAWLAEENGGRNPSPGMYVPGNLTRAAPDDAWYGTNLYTTLGTEAAKGYDPIRPGWTWSAAPAFRDLLLRSVRYGRVLSTRPVALDGGINTNTIFFAFQAPILANPQRWSAWAGIANPPPDADGTWPILYCRNDVACPETVNREAGVADPAVATVTRATPVDVPIYALPRGSLTNAGAATRLCTPMARPPYGSDATLAPEELVLLAPPGQATPCGTVLDQNAGLPLRSRKRATKRLAAVGAISGSFYADRIAWATLQRFRSADYLIAAEDVTGVPGFEFALETAAADDEVSAAPSESWRAMVRARLATPALADCARYLARFAATATADYCLWR